MSTPRRGPRRGQPERRGAATAPAGGQEVLARRWPVVLEWAAWIVLWIAAIGAGYFLGRIDVAKALFMTVMLAVTVLPWLRWVRRGGQFRLAPSRVAMLQGVLAIFVGLVLALSDTYWLALPVVVVELALAMVLLVKADRPAQQV